MLCPPLIPIFVGAVPEEEKTAVPFTSPEAARGISREW